MKRRDAAITGLVRQDTAESPLCSLTSLSARIRRNTPHARLDECARLLAEHDDDTAAELYLDELIGSTLRQHGPSMKLGPTFALAVRGIRQGAWRHLAPHTRAALSELARMALDEPVPVATSRELAHALVRNGRLAAYLTRSTFEALGLEPGASHKAARAAYRRLAQKHHPDKAEGNTERFRAVRSAYAALSA